MGIVRNQSFKNTITTYLGFGIGAINVLFLYTKFLPDNYHGLVAFVLSTANIMMPLFALGVHNTIVKFYSSFKTRNSINSFLTLMLILPMLVIVLVGLIGVFSFEWIVSMLSNKNPIIEDYVWLIYIAAICFGYFEVFYSWAKVQMQSVFGNFMKEVFHRLCILLLFVLIQMDLLSVPNFIYAVVAIYGLRLLIMMVYAFVIRKPVLRLGKIPNLASVLKYTLLIIIAGSVANIILEIDKFMIGQYIEIEKVAYYSVAIYIASTIGVPARSMHQITNPLSAKLLNEQNYSELSTLYKKSSLNLFIISGLIFVLILLNINQLYLLIPEEFSGGLMVVFLVGLAKLTDNLIGNNNAILFNSDYYRVALTLGAVLAVITIVFNMIFIPKFGIDGAAIATFLAIIIYNIAKLGFVYMKFNMSPFSRGTLKAFLLIAVLVLGFYFWDFSLHPIINIALKSIIVGIIYVYIVYKFNFSQDITSILKRYVGNDQ